MTITVFSKPGCPGCTASKRALTRAGVDFTVLDVTTDPDAAARVRELGYSSLPVVEAGEEHWSGFRPDRLRSLQIT